MSPYLLVFTVSNDCNVWDAEEHPGEGQGTHCGVEPLTRGNVSSQSCPGRNPAKSPGKEAPRPPLESLNNKTCGSQGASLIASCPIFISGMKGLPAVRRVTVGGSVASRFLSLCLLFFRRASCVIDKTRQTHALSSFP